MYYSVTKEIIEGLSFRMLFKLDLKKKNERAKLLLGE